MRTRRRAPIDDLQRAVACLPTATKIAMLEGIRTNEIIVGAYADGGGICPMLAAHRAGGRTSLISFAKAWDRFALRNRRSRSVRRATERELRILVTQLEASLLDDSAPQSELGAAIEDHRELVARRNRRADAAGRLLAETLQGNGVIRIYRQRRQAPRARRPKLAARQ